MKVRQVTRQISFSHVLSRVGTPHLSHSHAFTHFRDKVSLTHSLTSSHFSLANPLMLGPFGREGRLPILVYPLAHPRSRAKPRSFVLGWLVYWSFGTQTLSHIDFVFPWDSRVQMTHLSSCSQVIMTLL
ncbi:hypothetical protein CC79DRAFT_1197757 [Sarocladium strictum]